MLLCRDLSHTSSLYMFGFLHCWVSLYTGCFHDDFLSTHNETLPSTESFSFHTLEAVQTMAFLLVILPALSHMA